MKEFFEGVFGCFIWLILISIFWNLGFKNGIITIIVCITVLIIIAVVISKILNYLEEKRKREEENRKAWASEFKRKFEDSIRQCENNERVNEKIELPPNYESISLQEKLWLALNDASIPLQKLEDFVIEFTSETKVKK
jgi:uncharacterized membrane protein YraQ (UPF0718 family)